MKVDLILKWGKIYTLMISDVEIEHRLLIGDKIESRAFWEYCDKSFQEWFNNLYLFTVKDIRFSYNFKMVVYCEGDTKLYSIKKKSIFDKIFSKNKEEHLYIIENKVSKCLK